MFTRKYFLPYARARICESQADRESKPSLDQAFLQEAQYLRMTTSDLERALCEAFDTCVRIESGNEIGPRAYVFYPNHTQYRADRIIEIPGTLLQEWLDSMAAGICEMIRELDQHQPQDILCVGGLFRNLYIRSKVGERFGQKLRFGEMLPLGFQVTEDIARVARGACTLFQMTTSSPQALDYSIGYYSQQRYNAEKHGEKAITLIDPMNRIEYAHYSWMNLLVKASFPSVPVRSTLI